MQKPDITIIGSGALGSILTKALFEHDYHIYSIYNRTVEKADQLAEEVNADKTGTFPASSGDLGDLIVITVPDDSIASVSRTLSGIGGTWRGRYVIHCSGVHSSDILDDLKNKGALTAGFHPLQTFSARSSTSVFFKTVIDFEGEPEICSFLENLAVELGATPVKINKEEKIKLHLAAVLVCNYMVTLASMASDLLGDRENDVHPQLADLKPLMQQTLDNIMQFGVENSLSGPLRRKDRDTISKHLNVLEHEPGIRELYKQLGLYTINHVIRPDPSDAGFLELKKLLMGEASIDKIK